MLEIRNIHKSFGSTPVLGGIDLDVKQGDVIPSSVRAVPAKPHCCAA